MPAKLLTFVSSVLLVFTACYIGNAVKSETIEKILNTPEETLRVWVLSDIQPRNRKEKKEFEEAIEDVNLNIPDVDLVIVAGDIEEDASEEDFDWYLATKPSSHVREWYEIAGNHDLKLNDGKGYKEKIREDFYYSFTKGNILFVLMSDEVRGKPTEISDETFEWWKNLVINNQDKIIVVVTHAPLEGSGIPFSIHPDRQIKDSRRFGDVLKKYKVDMWFSGHLHIPHSLAGNIERKDKYNGTIFVNVSSIRSELLGLKKSESRIVTFVCGSDKVYIESRNHSRRKFDRELGMVFELSKKYQCENSEKLKVGS
ncbi:MAG TPA: metallophosphoesterase [Thermodesulfobacteriota bacterium]|nr:metallophosphoesterase [Thermodesulfobacteriota bacterium]